MDGATMTGGGAGRESPSADVADVDVLVIGSGFSGLGMGVSLKREGRRSFLILERASDLGGTWRDNRYPGCACDVPSALYSFSFAPNPNWTRAFSPQPEIWAYLKKVAADHGLEPHLRFDAAVVEARWDEPACRWRLATADGRRFSAGVVVVGAGALSRPAWPDIDGLETFRGDTLHSAAWRDDVAFEGRKVGVVGTGASAIQIVPQLAPLAERLTVFQRTPAWIIPKPDAEIPPATRERFARRPWEQQFWRLFIYAMLEKNAAGRIWPVLAAGPERTARRHLRAQVSDPALRAKLTPDYRLGCKRVLISDDFYPALTRDNVELETTAIARVDPGGVVLKDGRRVDLDVLVLATGFEVTDPQGDPLEVYGRGGLRLKAAWRDGAQAHLGITVAGFPNWFILMGPNTGLGHNSMIFMIESQIAYVRSALAEMDARGLAALEVRPEAQAAFVAEMDRRMAGTVFASGCRSWYLGEQSRNTTVWPGFTFDYRNRTRAIRLQDYRGT
ncbi:MAG: NAD(P)/FAD-dependent oxidoreductase [Caulobacteraceae bacterium]|nr:NAD(P)/FAD-dependent oxidoreductase [Caulobacteraceae bacterium]